MKPNFLQTAYQVSGRGIGQVMLQNNALSGWLMLAGICLCSWQMGLWALGGLAVSTLSACAFGYSKEAIRNGLFGFNGLLVGLAAALFLQPGFMAVCLMIAASVLSTVITHLFSLQHKLAGYTAPFILAVWILLALCHTFLPSCLQPTAESLSTTAPLQLLPSLCHSLGQVMFMEHLPTGLIFLLALTLHSRTSALYALWGALLSISLSGCFCIENASINAGLMGYNGVLCAIALGEKSRAAFLKATCAIALSVGMQWLGMHTGLITLTAPFVLSVWAVKAFDVRKK